MKVENAGSFLCTAVARGDSDYLKRLLSNGMDPNLKDYDYRSPLHIAAAEGLYFMAKLLLDAGANVFTKDRYHSSHFPFSAMFSLISSLTQYSFCTFLLPSHDFAEIA